MRVTAGIAIYGGGMAGAMLARRLAAHHPVVLVDPADFFEVPMAVPRNLVEPDFARRATVPFREALPGVQRVQGRLVDWTSTGGVVALADGDTATVHAEVSVLATGSRFANPLLRPAGGGRDDRLELFRSYAQRLARSRQVLIVGGGPVGVEIAGEVSSRTPEAHVTLIESGERLLKGTTEAAARHAASVLRGRGVTILLGDRLVQAPGSPGDPFAPPGEAVTASGRRIAYDLIVWCVGGQPNTDYLRAHAAEMMDAQDRIRVTPSLRVVGQTRLFALGDITDLPENKMAWHVAGQVDCAVANVRRVLAGRTAEDDLLRYRPQRDNPAMAVTLGPREGVICLPRGLLLRAGWINRRIKAAHMLVPKYRRTLGV